MHALLGVILPRCCWSWEEQFSGWSSGPIRQVPGLGSDEASLLSVMRPQVEPILPLTERGHGRRAGAVVPYREIVLAAEVGGRVIDKEQSVRPGHFVRRSAAAADRSAGLSI